MKKVALGVGLTITILTGCVSSPQSQEREASNSNLLSVEFVGNSSYKVPQQQGTVRLYALEKRMADAPATLIQEKKVQVSQIPFTVEFAIPQKHREHIQPAVKDNAELTYYVTWEADAANPVTKDTIMIDYDRQFPRVSLGVGKQQVLLRDRQ
ncbi:hypothetical protein [Acinetobacter junii]|uniref:hypothetical protein n=1 Tax=Acinetobacter junii TaxID=40215 RepID=UPI003AF60AB1